MPVVACPKCKTKFKLASDQLGKAVRCSSCQAKFRTAAPEAAGAERSAKPNAKPKAKSTKATPQPKPAAPAKKTPRTLEDELFASAPLKPGAPDPLGNFVLEDPGFGALELPDPEDDDGDSDDDMFADRQHLMNNPALKGRNPYASPSGSGSKGGKQQARKLRQRLLKHEGEVKCLGLIYMIFGVLGVVSGIVAIIMSMMASEDSVMIQMSATFLVIFGVVQIVSSIPGFVVGWYLFKLKNWAKIVVTIFLVVGLLGIPFGTAFGGFYLWVLHSEKGKQVFTDEYRHAVATTPDIQPGHGTLITIISLLVGGAVGYFAITYFMG